MAISQMGPENKLPEKEAANSDKHRDPHICGHHCGSIGSDAGMNRWWFRWPQEDVSALIPAARSIIYRCI